MTNKTEQIARITQIITTDQVPLSPRAKAMIDTIKARHKGAAKAFLFYGSSLREGDQSGKMLDFYVLTDSYREVYGRGLKQFLSFIVPPGVHYCETDGPNGERLRSKYAVISHKAFIRRASGGALESMLWARFSQPTRIICDAPALNAKLITACANACHHFLSQTLPLLSGPTRPREIWVRALTESYRSELRPENASGRATQIVNNDLDRYVSLALAMFPEGSADSITLPQSTASKRWWHKLKWAARRVIGKPMGLFRVSKAFFTFDNGVDYIVEKLTSHSDVKIQLTDFERKHPILNAPRVAWRLYRKGAFR